MRHQEGHFKGVRGLQVYYSAWYPETTSIAVLVVSHGIAEHCGRYMNLVNFFVPKGYTIYALDHIGHGKSDGPRVHLEKFADFTDNFKTFRDMVKKQHPEQKLILVGHSMGGLIAGIYLLDHQDDFDAVVFSAPAAQIPENTSPALIFTGKVLSALAPSVGLVQITSRGISRDASVVAAYENDPLVYTGKISARLAAEILASMRRLSDEAHTLRLPMLLLQGTEDTIVSPAGCKRLYEKAQSESKDMKVYPGLYHEVFNEPEHIQVLQDVNAWLEKFLYSAQAVV